MSDDRLKGRAAIEEIDRRLGGLLGPLAEGLARVVDAAERAQQAGGAHEATVETARGPLKVRTGFSVRVAGAPAAAAAARDPARPVRPASASAAQPSPAQPSPVAPAEDPSAEPAWDAFEDADAWSLTADMPGVAPGDLAVTVAPDGAVSVATTGRRRFRLDAQGPAWLSEATLETRLSNGVLDLSARRRAPPP
jgi:HSP20 family molecular chaperone IbpA